MITTRREVRRRQRQTTRKECSETEWSLARRLADYPWRLVVMRERTCDGRIVAEVAHEAFLRAWPRLREWLREERDFLIFKGEVEHAERRWREMNEDEKALLTGLDLTRAEEWLPTRGQDLSSDVTMYIQQSIAADRAAKEQQLAEKERQIRFQHRTTVGAVAAASIVTASDDKTARLWDAESGKLIGEPLRGHEGYVWSAAFSPDGKRIVTASEDKSARLWEIFPNTQAYVMHAHQITPLALGVRFGALQAP